MKHLFVMSVAISGCTAMIAGLIAPIASTARADAEPTVTIQANDRARVFTRSQLLAMPTLLTIAVENDPAYPKRKMSYRAVPLAALFEGIRLESSNTLLFKSLDGFSAPISVLRILNSDPKKSRAFLAIEPADAPWPAVKDGKTAGPFYVIWQNPSLSNIGTEEWPYQISGFDVKPSFETQFPKTKPASGLSHNDAVSRGYLTFQKTCFACHTLNGEGSSRLGPDLNIPLNPTEYFKSGMIEKLVRNPQSLRHWPDAKMPALSRDAISDRDLQDVVAYLKHMSHRKTPN